MTRPAPLVSVGLPVFNGVPYLGVSIESILRQTYENLELVISDNASTDETEAICRQWAARDPRVRYSRCARNIGGFRNQNRVFELSQGKYFHWIGHDDRRAPEFLERTVRELEADPGLVACYSRTAYIGPEDEPLPDTEREIAIRADTASQRFAEMIRMDHRCEPIFGVIRSDVLRRTGLQGQYADADRVLTAELALHGRFLRLDAVLIYRRIHPAASIVQHPERRDRTAWIDPDRPHRLVFPYWRQFAEYLRAIARAAPPATERLRCYGRMAGWLAANRRSLLADLTTPPYELVRRGKRALLHRGDAMIGKS